MAMSGGQRRQAGNDVMVDNSGLDPNSHGTVNAEIMGDALDDLLVFRAVGFRGSNPIDRLCGRWRWLRYRPRGRQSAALRGQLREGDFDLIRKWPTSFVLEPRRW
jgi:hypothetical protein